MSVMILRDLSNDGKQHLFVPIASLHYGRRMAYFNLIWMLEKQEFWLLYDYTSLEQGFDNEASVHKRATELYGTNLRMSLCALEGLDLNSREGTITDIRAKRFSLHPTARIDGLLRPIDEIDRLFKEQREMQLRSSIS